MTIGLIVKQLRREKRLSQKTLATMANVQPCVVSRVERGHGCTLATVEKLLAALNHELEVVPNG